MPSSFLRPPKINFEIVFFKKKSVRKNIWEGNVLFRYDWHVCDVGGMCIN